MIDVLLLAGTIVLASPPERAPVELAQFFAPPGPPPAKSGGAVTCRQTGISAGGTIGINAAGTIGISC